MANIVKIKNSSTSAASPTGLVAGEIAINVKDKKLFFLNELGVLQSFDLFPPVGTTSRNVLTLANLFSSTSVTRVNVTGMSFAVAAGKKYKITLIGDYQTAALTTGGSLGFILTSGTGNIKGFVTMSISQSVVATDLTTTIRAINSINTTAGSFTISTGVSVINSPHYFCAELIFDCLTTGVFQLQWATEVAASSAQINAGSVMIVETLN